MTPSISNPVGTRFVATRSPNRDGWEIKRYRPGESGQPVSAEQYVNDLPGQLDLSAIRRFLDHPSPMAVFERHHNGKVETVGIKLVPWFTDPDPLVQTLTTRTIGTDIAAAHPELARLYRLIRYHWESPEFCDLCDLMGLDPDQARPRFQPHFEDLAEALMRWSSTEAHDLGTAWDSPRGEARIAIYNLLGMMRVNANPRPDQLEELRRRWARADTRVVQRSDDVDELIQSDRLLGAARRIH